MAKGDDDQDAPQRKECGASPKSEEHQGARDQLHTGYDGARGPKRPRWEEGNGVRLYEQAAGMFNGTESEHLPESGHEEDKAEDCSGDEEGPGAVGLTSQQLSFPYTLSPAPVLRVARYRAWHSRIAVFDLQR